LLRHRTAKAKGAFGNSPEGVGLSPELIQKKLAAPEQQTGGNLRLPTEEQDPDDAEFASFKAIMQQ